ncbi:MAG: glycosyl hydrolase [Gemmatimonadetes bacterium]|nr:glycosyl hydrolase [Gemmatimonadota bacterium]
MSDASRSKSRAASLDLVHGNAVCYSGYREGQSPDDGVFPTHEEIREDLLILAKNWKYLRLYDSQTHAERTLDVIHREGLDFKVMLGMATAAEANNPKCPWGAEYDAKTLRANREANDAEVDRAIALANRYPNIVFSVSIGNEAVVEWTDHPVPVKSLLSRLSRLKAAIDQPVTFCENYVPWTDELELLADELDFLSVHTYPVWEYQSLDAALAHTQENYYSVADHYPGKPVVITEAGWTTASNGRGIEPANASEKLQAKYYEKLLAWTTKEKILTFVFEAFDEPWKGSHHPLEPEKHWGLFRVDRTPKLVMRETYPELLNGDG